MGWYWNMKEAPQFLQGIPYLPSTLMGYAYRGVTALVAIMAIFYIAPRCLYGNGLVNRIAAQTGKVSLGIYILHLIVLGISVSCLKALNVDNTLLIVVTSFMLYIISMAMVYVIQKSKLANRILLGKLL